MVNSGSPVSAQRVVNVNEFIYEIKDGEMKNYVWDDSASGWVKNANLTTALDPQISRTWAGKEFRTGHLVSGLDNTSSIDYLILTSNQNVHLEMQIIHTNDCEEQFYENPVVTSNGVLLGTVNVNRTAVYNLPTSLIYTSTTTTSAGIQLGQCYLPQYTTWSPVTPEYILEEGSAYLLRIISYAAGNVIQVVLRTYYYP
jgi:hypothetical protein